jgi:acyl-CoA dehydrogenase
MPIGHRRRLSAALDRALAFAEQVASTPKSEDLSRKAATALYNVTSAVLLAYEGAQDERDARRLLLSRMVLVHRLAPEDPLGQDDLSWEDRAIDFLLSGDPVPRAEARSLAVG